ncbi:TetR family transcriptional regulator [Pseudodesulfovibrio cashew]|uniref:TetR family transcriptional regulator n=1 Tax=Pseudodesulfovibrio cashew TaxID=2678688 RepID=A0A6I6J9P3_9BACT|nr:TetR/AcrR family transcriptional regulator [Pseudodesulfovibrio cashew]QGY39526.1 TetR family transcriptional regulator [Pseudodesulfovibrio cashew]
MGNNTMSADMRTRVIKAAADCFDERGVEGTEYSHIAEAAGVSIEDIKSEFGSKEELALDAQSYEIERLTDEYLANMPDASPRDAVKFIFRTRLSFIEAKPNRTKLFLSEAIQGKSPWSERLDQVIWHVSIELASLLERGIREGRFEKNTDAQLVVRALTSIYLTGVVTIGMRREKIVAKDVWDFIEPQIDLIFDCIRA